MTVRCLILVLAAATAYAVDLAPPAVPNPYGTSDARAIRDAMDELFHQKVSEKMSLVDLQALYRKTWNDDQQKRFDDGKPVDPAWAKAQQEEEAAGNRARLVDDLNRLGGKANDSMTDADLKQAIALRKDNAAKADRDLQAAEEAKRREDLSRQIEGEQKAKP